MKIISCVITIHEIDLGAYFIMSEVADIFSNNMDKV